MMTGTAPQRVRRGRAIAVRFAAFYALWIVLIGAAFTDLGAGLVAAAAATWTSLELLPPDGQRTRWLAVVAMVPSFLRKSVVAGLDVALRALAPRVRLATGFLAYRAGFPRGTARNAFTMYTSLMPGTVPCADEHEAIVYHCLDTSQPVASDLAEEEHRIAGVVQEPRVG
jgi:multicomponent Na+:H+ antiporter subunit E